ncbi:MAG: C-terminal binding protein [Chloroflexi bacterium]|nr:C-terminal binding protein [Chloroflexota bacterium]
MQPSRELRHKVALIDYDPALFAPMGDEAERLAAVDALWTVHQCRSAEETLAAARDAVVVVVQSVRPLLTRAVIAQLPAARCLIRAGAGYDSIDYKAATAYGKMVCNTPTYCTDDVADHAIALMLASVRHIARLDAALRRDNYARALARPTRRVRGTTLGLIGYGRIGHAVAQRVRGWEMRVLACDPYISEAYGSEWGARLVSMDELLAESDFVSLHCPLDESTHHILGAEQFARIKPGAVLVNTARGPLVDEAALVEALRSGRILAAGLDVTEQEPLAPESPLLKLDNVILTPHISANSEEARADLYRLICELSIDVVQGRVPAFVVNPEVLKR